MLRILATICLIALVSGCTNNDSHDSNRGIQKQEQKSADKERPKNPTAPKQLLETESTSREEQAAAALQAGKEYLKNKRIRTAMKSFENVVEEFGDTKAAEEARKLIAENTQASDEQLAGKKLDHAKDLQSEGKRDAAKKILQGIIATYPRSEAAKEAAELLKGL